MLIGRDEWRRKFFQKWIRNNSVHPENIKYSFVRIDISCLKVIVSRFTLKNDLESFQQVYSQTIFPTATTVSNSTELQKTYKSKTEITWQIIWSYQRSSTPPGIKSARNIDCITLCVVNSTKEFIAYFLWLRPSVAELQNVLFNGNALTNLYVK